MIQRNLDTAIRKLMKQYPAVAILGPRQVGKTTLAKKIASGKKNNTIYLDLEKAADRSLLHDAHSYLEIYKNKCVILDEVQLMPELFSVLRPLIDEHRKAGRFILLGSASPALVKGVSETLAGRISYKELSPIGISELPEKISMRKHWLRGGFPDSLLAKSDAMSQQWLNDFIRSYVERDMELLFGISISNNTLQKLWTMVAHTSGNVWNAETYARSIGVTAPTILRYIDYMEGSFMIRRLQPWFINTKKRLVKAPKVYVRDTGILHQLLHIHSYDSLLHNPIVGASWESYVVEQIAQSVSNDLQLYYYRTQDGAECDLVLVRGITPVACIEIKHSNSPTVSKGFFHSINDLKPKHHFVITPASKTFITNDKVTVCSLQDFLAFQLNKL
jgi:predicted AAA+ superfamily ATPase